MIWYIKNFNELTGDELYQIFQLRAEIFVVEQNCVYQDLDGKDQKSLHLFTIEDGEVVAYLRILPQGISYPEISIGRVAVKKTYRRRKIAEEMMKRALRYIAENMNECKVRISAQLYLKGFYENLGFVPVSEVYQEDGIEHIEMLRTE